MRYGRVNHHINRHKYPEKFKETILEENEYKDCYFNWLHEYWEYKGTEHIPCMICGNEVTPNDYGYAMDVSLCDDCLDNGELYDFDQYQESFGFSYDEAQRAYNDSIGYWDMEVMERKQIRRINRDEIESGKCCQTCVLLDTKHKDCHFNENITRSISLEICDFWVGE